MSVAHTSQQVDNPLRYLHSRGLHAVLCGEDKRPVWGHARGWQKRRPTLELLELHERRGGLVGIVPSSVACTAFDLDRGGPSGWC